MHGTVKLTRPIVVYRPQLVNSRPVISNAPKSHTPLDGNCEKIFMRPLTRVLIAAREGPVAGISRNQENSQGQIPYRQRISFRSDSPNGERIGGVADEERRRKGERLVIRSRFFRTKSSCTIVI